MCDDIVHPRPTLMYILDITDRGVTGCHPASKFAQLERTMDACTSKTNCRKGKVGFTDQLRCRKKREAPETEREFSCEFQGIEKKTQPSLSQPKRQLASLLQSSKRCTEQAAHQGGVGGGLVWIWAPRGICTKAAPFCDSLWFPRQKRVSRVPPRRWAWYGIFFGTNSAAVHQLIEPGSRGKLNVGHFSSSSTWAINTPKQKKRGLMRQQRGTHAN